MRKRMRYIVFLGMAAMVVGLSSCVTSRRVNYMQEPDKKIPAYADTLSFEDYQLRVNDRLFIYVYSLDEKITALYNSGMTNTNIRQQIRHAEPSGLVGDYHPLAKLPLAKHPFGWDEKR